MNDEIKLRTCKEIIRGQNAAGMRPRAGRMATASQDKPGHDPKSLPKGTKAGQNGRPFGVARWSWPHALNRGIPNNNPDDNVHTYDIFAHRLTHLDPRWF